MSERESFDPASVAAMLIVIAVMLAAVIHLLPVALQAVLQMFPSVLILLIIAGVLTAMIRRLID